jgi:hypothetical protein
MFRPILLVTASLIMGLSSPAGAMGPEGPTPPRYGVSASAKHAVRGNLLIAFAENNPGRWITEFWAVSPNWMAPGAKPIVLARRALDAWNGQEQIQWADSRTCSGLVEALITANNLPLPDVIVPLDESSRSQARESGIGAPAIPDGYGPSVFWAPGRGQPAVEFQFSAYRGPWVDWQAQVLATTNNCWQSDQPLYPGV